MTTANGWTTLLALLAMAVGRTSASFSQNEVTVIQKLLGVFEHQNADGDKVEFRFNWQPIRGRSSAFKRFDFFPSASRTNESDVVALAFRRQVTTAPGEDSEERFVFSKYYLSTGVEVTGQNQLNTQSGHDMTVSIHVQADSLTIVETDDRGEKSAWVLTPVANVGGRDETPTQIAIGKFYKYQDGAYREHCTMKFKRTYGPRTSPTKIWSSHVVSKLATVTKCPENIVLPPIPPQQPQTGNAAVGAGPSRPLEPSRRSSRGGRRPSIG